MIQPPNPFFAFLDAFARPIDNTFAPLFLLISYVKADSRFLAHALSTSPCCTGRCTGSTSPRHACIVKNAVIVFGAAARG
jgi:hypothetical protein